MNYSGNYCEYLPKNIIVQLDYTNSYFCIIATTLYLIKFEFMNDNFIKTIIKITIYSVNYVMVVILLLQYRTTQIPALFTSLNLIIVLVFFVSNINKYSELYFTYNRTLMFLFGFGLSLISFITYLYISINNLQNDNNYWLYHSYLWHVPVLLSPVFIIESATIAEKSFFNWIIEQFTVHHENIIRRNYEITEIEII